MSKFKFQNNRTIRISILICLLLFCSAFLGFCDDVEYKYESGCADGAEFEKSSVSGTSIVLKNRQKCDGEALLSDIFLYTGTGDVTAGATVDSVTSSLQSVVQRCAIRNHDGVDGWAQEDTHSLTLGNQIFVWVLCAQKKGNGNAGTRVVDVKFSTIDGLLTNGPDCNGVLGNTFDVEKTESEQVNVCCVDEAGDCKVNRFGVIDMSCVETRENQYGITGQYSVYVNRGGFYDLNADGAGNANPKSHALCVPTTISLDGKSVSFGFDIACDNDGLCMNGEQGSTCADCLSCEERAKTYVQEGPLANKDNQIKCQGDFNLPAASFSRNPFCKWCPKPYQGQGTAGGGAHIGSAYPFMLPGYSTDDSAKSGCVHVTGGDPFNCGACGLSKEIPAGSANEFLATNSFCAADLGSTDVYCVQSGETNYWSCDGGDGEIDMTKQPWFMKYPKHANPSFFYTVESDGKGGFKSSVSAIPAPSGSLPNGGGVDGTSSSGGSSPSGPRGPSSPNPSDPNNPRQRQY